MKIYKLLLIGISLTFLISCAHHHDRPEHHHHAYNKKCAYSIVHNDMDTVGKDEFKIEHKDVTYYFSTKEKLDLFEKELEKNIKKANRIWGDRGGALR